MTKRSSVLWPLEYATVLTAVAQKIRIGPFVALTKPRIIELLLVTTVPTMVLAKQGLPSLWLMVATVVGGALAAGGANAYNMYVDRDIDAIMHRTQKRPLVTGDVSPKEALLFATVIEALAFGWLWFAVNPLSAWLALSACAFYVFVYTMWLKRTSTQNIVIGGAAGAVPALVGWSSVTETVGLEAFILFAVIFFWTPPHFWALAIKYERDYTAANVPMMPSVAGHKKTAVQMTAYAVVVFALTIWLWYVGELGWLYLGASIVFGAAFVYGSFRLVLQTDQVLQEKQAMKYFTFSISYLFVLFSFVAIDQLVGFGT